ncbi:MAG: hypothetical protein PPP55_00330 [Halorubrum sp.]
MILFGEPFEREITFTEFFTGTRWAPDHATPATGVRTFYTRDTRCE